MADGSSVRLKRVKKRKLAMLIFLRQRPMYDVSYTLHIIYPEFKKINNSYIPNKQNQSLNQSVKSTKQTILYLYIDFHNGSSPF